MGTLVSIARAEILLVCGLLFGVVVFKLLTGQVNTGGLLRDKFTGELSPGRAQLLAFTVTLAGLMLLQIGELPAEGKIIAPSGHLVLVYAGSHVAYLLGKYRSFTRGRT